MFGAAAVCALAAIAATAKPGTTNLKSIFLRAPILAGPSPGELPIGIEVLMQCGIPKRTAFYFRQLVGAASTVSARVGGITASGNRKWIYRRATETPRKENQRQ